MSTHAPLGGLGSLTPFPTAAMPMAPEPALVRLGELREVEVATVAPESFSADRHFAAASSGASTRELLLAVEGQSRALESILAACAVGAASLPAEVLASARAAAFAATRTLERLQGVPVV